MAKAFGAKCVKQLGPTVTHLVAAQVRLFCDVSATFSSQLWLTRPLPFQADTQKVHRAAKFPNVKIVYVQWIRYCFDSWHRQKEEPYILTPVAAKPEVASATGTTPPGSPNGKGPGVETSPPTPSTETTSLNGDQQEMAALADAELDLDLDMDAMDAEMEAFLAEAESEAGSEDGASAGEKT